MARVGLVALALLALLPGASHAGEAPPCEARFLVLGEPLFGDFAEVIDVQGDGVSIPDHCRGKKARVRTRPEGTQLRVRFSDFCPPGYLCPSSNFGPFLVGPRRISLCHAMKGVRIEVVVDPSCETLTGRLRARSPRLFRDFVAVVSPLAPPECVPNAQGDSCACGTLVGLACADDAFCQVSGDLCSEEGRVGNCTPVPADCPHVSQPVCGCNGVTYDNDCWRRAALASLAHQGACEVAASTHR